MTLFNWINDAVDTVSDTVETIVCGREYVDRLNQQVQEDYRRDLQRAVDRENNERSTNRPTQR